MECPTPLKPLETASPLLSFASPFPFTHIKLEPFAHQVGGHSSMLCLDHKTVCKPLILQERHFYETLPAGLLPFTPAYQGVVAVQCSLSPDQDDSTGYITLTAYPPPWYKDKLTHNIRPTMHRIKFRRGGSIEIESDTDVLFDDDSPFPLDFHEVFSPFETIALSSSPSWSNLPSPEAKEARRPSLGHNPWILHCHRDHLTRLLGQDPSNSNLDLVESQEFLLLENLTWRCKRPCVLDLKMGVRQFGDDASLAKRQSQSAKAATSTSGLLGSRICGMQVFQITTGRFLCRNKYFGRSLTVEGFRDALRQFFHNGNALRNDILPLVIRKLHQVRKILQELPGYRFYTSSLLIIYDGYVPDGHDVTKSLVLNEDSNGLGSVSSNHAQALYTDVRIIDFAHATHPNLPQTPVKIHNGPDQGFLFGIDNLLKVLSSL